MNINNFAHKVIKQDKEYDDYSVSFKADVHNTSDDEEVYLTIKGLDGDGFEIYNTSMSGKIALGASKVLTELDEGIEGDVFRQIADWVCDEA